MSVGSCHSVQIYKLPVLADSRAFLGIDRMEQADYFAVGVEGLQVEIKQR
jgi:hypothetical protein